MIFKQKSIKEIIENYDLNPYWNKLNKTNFITHDNDLIGFIDYYIKPCSQTLYIEMIEVIDKNIGCGKNIIDYIFTEFLDIDYIKGLAVPSSFMFWEAIGCVLDFKTSKDEYIENDKCCTFILSKGDFYKSSKFRVEYYVNKKDFFIIDCNYNDLSQAIEMIKEMKEDGDIRGENGEIYYRKYPLINNKKTYIA